MSTFGARIAERRNQLNMSRTRLAKLSGMSYSTLAGIETGDQKSSTKIHRLAAALKVDPEWLEDGVGVVGDNSGERVADAVAPAVRAADALTLRLMNAARRYGPDLSEEYMDAVIKLMRDLAAAGRTAIATTKDAP